MARKRQPKNAGQQPARRQRQRGRRGPNARTLAQGVGVTPNTPFGGRVGYDLRCWDAKLPMHLPLPRAVGPYTVIRTTRRLASNRECMVFGAFQDDISVAGATCWTNICALGSVVLANPVNGAGNTYQYVMSMGGLGTGCSIVPSAVTVQVMNPAALQTTNGIIYIGTMNTQAAFSGDTATWIQRFDTFVEFQNPRLCAAAKLALRGVQVNSFPLNMSKLADFTALGTASDGPITWNDPSFRPTGWSPIVVYNPNAVNLEYLVTIEWRVRFDLDNVAAASHTHYPMATDSTWDKLTTVASGLGHGAQDIADIVSTVGGMARAMKPYVGAATSVAALA